MKRPTSIVRRVAWGLALSASAAALVAAVSTSALAAMLLQRAEDRRLLEAAFVLAEELSAVPIGAEHTAEVVRDESEETNHTGILFAVFGDGARIAGDERILLVAQECESRSGLRLCRAACSTGAVVVAASEHAVPIPLFALAAFAATIVAGAAAWFASGALSRAAVAPLSRLRSRIDALDIDNGEHSDLGKVDHVSEVDALRDTVQSLLERVRRSLEQSQRFSANAAHELRTPLTSVRAELELLAEDETLSSDAGESIERVRRKVAELDILVERLLILASPRRTSTEAAEVTSMRDAIEDVVSSLPAAERGRVVLALDTDAQIRGDAVLLSAMIANALSNALKYEGEVRVSTGVHDDRIVVAIDDDGPGIAEEDRERVFEPFFRTSDSLRRRIPGHGLGLALIRHIAETHGGYAGFVGKQTTGARLEISFPGRDASRSPTSSR